MPSVPNREIIEFGAFQIDLQSGELRKNGIAIKLGSREAHVLLALIENPGQLVTRAELRQRLWPDDTFVEFDNGLNNAISRLRSALSDTADSPRFVQTVPRQGYRFAAPVNRRTPAKRKFNFSGWPRIAAATMVVLLIAAFSWRHFSHASGRIESVAVLPFAVINPVDGLGGQYLSAAVTDAVFAKLSTIRNLTVSPPETVATYANASASIRQIARNLHVDAVAKGAVHIGNNDLQVSVQLVDSRGTTIWSESYQQQLRDFPLLTRSVVRGIIRAAGVQLSPQDQQAFALQQEVSPQAFEAFEKGLYCLSQQTENSRTRALGYFRQAVAAAPNFAEAYAGLANYYVNTGSIPPEIAMRGAKSYAAKAVELNSIIPYPHTALAVSEFYGDWDWSASETEFRRALALNPGVERTHRLYAALLSSESDVDDAVQQIREAHDIDPLSIPVYHRAAIIWINAHQYSQAIDQANQMLALNPTSVPGHEALGTAFLFQGEYAQAVREFEDAAATKRDSPHANALLGAAYARWGRNSLATRQLGELRRLDQSGYVPPYWYAIVYASSGDTADALNWLQRAYEQHDPHLVDLKASPWFDSLHEQPQFAQLVKQMKFPN
ncbi:MAG TPA: winged helix-turn-helix domain-containing protein [Candidatus Acidoferrales bacterium]|nr:winged helix-turn-helix domain-containing protein [Candidatus Acidoferrales bacterium]